MRTSCYRQGMLSVPASVSRYHPASLSYLYQEVLILLYVCNFEKISVSIESNIIQSRFSRFSFASTFFDYNFISRSLRSIFYDCTLYWILPRYFFFFFPLLSLATVVGSTSSFFKSSSVSERFCKEQKSMKMGTEQNIPFSFWG